ncbi:ABC transporter substrate-binding protein [Streptosporangium soli]|nr:ABC transporter substrate-binding protein [Streptosporangium sp. KLBMP 9127]
MTVRSSTAASLLLATAIAGCGAPAGDDKKYPPVNVQAESLREGFSTPDRLAEAARKEGTLTVIGLPHDWVNYGEILDAFAAKYDIKVEQLEPAASSQREIQAATHPKPGAQVPDVFDLSLDVAVANAALFAPYRVQAWQDIPDDLKDHEGAWYAGYGGYMSIGYDPRKVGAPASYSDLLKPGYSVALPGSPLQTSAAFNGVMAASLTAGQALAERGVRLFARLKRAGNLVATGKTPTAIVDWDFLNAQRASHGDWKVTIPRDATLGSYYVQAINKKARHPAAARLWQEFLYSDEGQNLFLKGYARPARLEALRMRGTIDKEAAGRLPAAPGKPVFLTIPQADAAKTYLQRHWPKSIR